MLANACTLLHSSKATACPLQEDMASLTSAIETATTQGSNTLINLGGTLNAKQLAEPLLAPVAKAVEQIVERSLNKVSSLSSDRPGCSYPR